MTGWPNEEFYTPHSGGAKVHDGHWSGPAPKHDRKKGKSTHAHGRKKEV